MSAHQLQLGEDERSIMLRRAWARALPALAEKISKASYQSYILPIRPVLLENQEVTLGVASGFARDWVERRYARHIVCALESVLGCPVTLRFRILTERELTLLAEEAEAVVTSSAPATAPAAPPSSPSPAKRPSTAAAAQGRGADSASRSLPLNERYRFETFVVGKSNRLAHAGATAVATSPATAYNPLFLYGGPGVGKTHLLHSIGHSVRELNPGARIGVIDGESFTYQFVTALRERKTEEFRRHFRGVDLWLVDDIQFIAGKEQTKEEFFHTFNALYQSGKQIVLASDRSPKELRAIDERLRSRFECGLIADIAAPELETRMAILQLRCASEGWNIAPEILYFVAGAIASNVRSLEGAITKLVAYASIMKCEVTLDVAREVLGEFILEKPLPGVERKGITMETILAAVAEQCDTTVEAIRGPRRDQAVVLARQVAMTLCRELTETNLAQIGAAIGGRDHTTVQRGIARIESLLPHDSRIQTILAETRERLQR